MAASQSVFTSKRVSVGEAARYYSKSTETIRNWCKDGTLIMIGCLVIRGPKRRWQIVLPSQ